MEIIQELEPENRGYYCGALGWLDPGGDFAFSVPIRTVEIERDNLSRKNTFSLGVGAGITIDSDPKEEWHECKIKSAFLTKLIGATGLFETIAINQNVPQRLQQHLDRLESSATALRIAFDQKHASTLAL